MPGEESPLTGPITLYFSDQEWREKVRKLISISRVVVVQAGVASGLEWEMRTAKEVLRPDQLIISLKTWKSLDSVLKNNAYEVFSRNAERVFGVKFPREHSGAEFRFFDSTWSPHLARRGFLKAVAYHYESRRESATDSGVRGAEVEFAKYIVSGDTSFDFRGMVRKSWLRTDHLGKYGGWLSLGIISVALAAVSIIAYQLIFADRSQPPPKVENARSFFADAKWTKFSPSDASAFTLEIPGEPQRTATPELHKLFANGRRSDMFKMSYEWYSMTVYVDRYVFSNDRATLDEISERSLKTYKDETVKVLSASTKRDADGVLYLDGVAEITRTDPSPFGPQESSTVFLCNAAVSIRGREAVVVFVLFNSDAIAGRADAIKSVQRIVSSIRQSY